MSLLKSVIVLSLTTGFILAQEDADIPPRFKNLIDDATYFQLRTDHLNLLRGLPADPALRTAAIQQMQGQRVALTSAPAGSAAAAAAALTWTPIGPSPIPNGQVIGALPVSGRTTALAIDPTNTNILYLGTAQSGVYRSKDGGANWTQIFDMASSSAVGSLALAPSNHTILYIGTGEANGSGDSFAGVGLYRIDNADTTANLAGPINPVRNYTDGSGNPVSNPAFNGRSISSIIVNPTDPSTLYVGVAGGVIGIGGESPLGGTIPPLGMRGLYRLTNATGAPASVAVQKIAITTGGSGFDLPNTGNRNIDSMAIDPQNPDVMLVWANGNAAAGDGGIYRSTNATTGTPTFTQVLTTATNGARAIFASYKQASALVIYAATGEVTTGTLTGTLRVSSDSGVSWTTTLASGAGFCGGQCFYNIGIDVLPGLTPALTDDIIVLGGNTPGASSKLFGKSTNGGATFVETSSGLHADTHFIRFDTTDPNVVYHGDDGGIFKSTSGGSTWTSLSNTQINSVQFSGLAVHPVDAKWTMGGTQDNGTNIRNSAGAWNRADFGDGGYALVDRNATDTTVMTLYHTYFNQTNNLIGFGRVLSSACASDGKWAFKGVYGGTAADPTPNCDSSDTFNGIVRSDAVLFYAPMELGPGNPNTVYFGAGALYRSTDRGETMPAVSQRTASPISSVTVSPQDDNYRLFGRRDGSLWYTTTGVNLLTQLTGIPAKFVGRVKFDPLNKNTAYVSLGGYFGGTATSQSHVWRVTSLNTTPVVTGLNNGLPDVPANSFAIDPANSSNLFVGTDIGVFASLDGGSTWSPYGTGLPVVTIFGAEIQAQSRTLRIATHGRGMWDIALPPVATNVTGQFTISNFAPGFNRATGKWTQTVTVTNNSAAILNGALVLDNLSAGWTLTNGDGTTIATTPAGSPYKIFGALGTGATVTFQLTFNRVGTTPFGYTSRILDGTTR